MDIDICSFGMALPLPPLLFLWIGRRFTHGGVQISEVAISNTFAPFAA